MKKPWCKMSSAPKNGKWVLLAEDGYLTGNKGIRYVASYWTEALGGFWIDSVCGGNTQVIAIGWMPLAPLRKS